MKTSRLIDIAKRAKVSPTTVSRVINKSPIPRLETKEKVMEVIRQMNYVPNLMARNLARGRYKKRHKTDNIGFLVSGIPRSSFMMDDGFYSRIFFGIETGFDDLPSAGHSQPGLTSIRMPMEDMGCTGVKLLFETMEKPDYIVRSVVLNVQLIVRESTASLCRDASSENRR